jgi:hypothetical protein
VFWDTTSIQFWQFKDFSNQNKAKVFINVKGSKSNTDFVPESGPSDYRE